jgi:tetratricopeptide (TPR) repeat protein
LRHASQEEADFFAPPKQPAVSDTTDDFSDLAAAYRGPVSKGAKRIALFLVVVAILAVGGLALYRYVLDPYANVKEKSALVRPRKKKDSPVEKKLKRAPPPGSLDAKHATASTRARKGQTPAGGRPGDVASGQPPSGETPPGTDLPPPEAVPPSPAVAAKAEKALSLWKKDRTQAVKLLEEVISANPQHEKAKQKLAEYYEKKAWRNLNNGRLPQAAQQARKAVTYNPQTRLAWFCLGFAQKQQNKKAAARRALQQYLTLCKTGKCRMEAYAKRYLKALK